MKAKYLLEIKTGYKMVDTNDVPAPFLYSYTSGSSVYKAALRVKLGGPSEIEFAGDVITDTRSGTVRYHHSILAEAPGNEETCRQNILNAFEGLLVSTELESVQNSYHVLQEDSVKSGRAVEEMSLLGYIPGSCSVCRRLGM
jgi:hypothetical protein